MAKKTNKNPAVAKSLEPAASPQPPSHAARRKIFAVRGAVFEAGGSPAAGLTVVAFDRDVAGEDRLGDATTDKRGAFKITYTAAQFRRSANERAGADLFVRVYGTDGEVRSQSGIVRSAAADVVLNVQLPGARYVVRGLVRLPDDQPLAGVLVRAHDQDLRSKTLLGKIHTAADGRFEIAYTADQFRRAEKGGADLLLEAVGPRNKLLAESLVLFNAPPTAEINLTVSADVWPAPTLFEKIGTELTPLLEDLKVEELEEDNQHRDLSFLATETGLEKIDLGRFALAHRLTQPRLDPEFWFALLGGSFFEFAENQSLAAQLATIQAELPSLDSAAVRKALTRAFGQKEISPALRKKVSGWTDAFLCAAASQSVSASDRPTIVRSALDHAGIESTEKQEKFARLFNEHRAFTPQLLKTLGQDKIFDAGEVADLHASFRLADVSGADFSVVALLKEEFSIREPEKIRALAKLGEQEWIDVAKKHPGGGKTAAAAKALGKKLEQRFREAFPTVAFAGGLERAIENNGARGLSRAPDLSRFLAKHDEFELLHTSVDDFLQNRARPEFRKLAKDEDFRLEMKAVQRVFKLAPSFEATDTLLADDLHSSQKIYRMGESEFVRSYANRPGFTAEKAREVWNRAADTHAAVLTFVADLKSFEDGPLAVQNDTTPLSRFPYWENLFKTGDQCACEPCRSVIGPAAYFADLLMFLKDRKSRISKPGGAGKLSLKDLLFRRRPDLGYLELNCDNSLIPLPYIDVVCEVLEAVVAAGAGDVELTGFTTVPSTWVGATLTQFKKFLVLNRGGDPEISFSQVDPADPDRWVLHSESVTLLLKKKNTPHFFAEILRNTKATAAELRAYPQYVNAKAYEKLRAAKYPFSLPFDLYAEEVRAVFQKANLRRWELMRTFQGSAAPNNPTESDIAAEYFGISVSAKPADPSEKSIIVNAVPTSAAQRIFWGAPAIPGDLAIVTVFLRKTRLEYNQLLALLDLKFINPTGDLVIRHLDTSCDTDKKVIGLLDAPKLDRIHRFLRLWRKLPGWKMWELDLAIGHPRIGGGSIDERFLTNLFYFSETRTRLGGNATVEQVCALFGDLNTTTRFTALHEKRGDALYQSLFLNKSLIHPLDPSLAVALVDVAAPTTEAISKHQPAVLAALGLKEADLDLLKGLTKVSDGSAYVTDDLTLTNLSVLWRHAWLAKRLKFSATDWATLLKIAPETVPAFATLTAKRNFLETEYHIDSTGLTQAEADVLLARLFRRDLSDFASPKSALEFLEEIQHLKASGFSTDELNWLLSADASAKTATKATDAARGLATLRKELETIRAEYAPARYDFLATASNEEAPSGLLATLLQKLHRDETAVTDFLKILRGSVQLSTSVTGLPAAFAFPAPITAAAPAGEGIPIQRSADIFRFSGLMSDAQRTVLLNNTAIPAAVRSHPVYQSAIAELYDQSLRAMTDSFTMERDVALPAGFVFPAKITGAPNAIPIRYDQRLRFTAVMTAAQYTTLLTHPDLPTAVTGLAAYQDAIEEFFLKPRLAIKFFEPVFTAPLAKLPDEVDFKVQLPGRISGKISYEAEQRRLQFSGIMSAAEKSALLGLSGEADFVAAVNDLASQPEAIADTDNRVWLTDTDLDFTLPATDTYAKRLANAAQKALRHLSTVLTENAVVQQGAARLGLSEALTRRLLSKYAIVPTPPALPDTTLMTHLLGDFALDATTFNSWFWANRVAAILKKWKLTPTEWEKIDALTTAAELLDFTTLPLEAATGNASLEKFLRTSRLLKLRDALPAADVTLLDVLEKLNQGTYAAAAAASTTGAPEEQLFADDVEQLNEAWRSSDVETLIGALDLAYPSDYLRTESWERLRRAFEFLHQLNASADTVKTLAAPAMTDVEAKTVKELLRSKFGTETWLNLSAEIQDVLRERKRDALAAYLLTQPKPADAPTGKWENTNDLYAYYLLDVDMSSCQLTSRLVQGSGSIQLFVQRCFMGLEPAVVVEADGANGDSAWRWWKWMRKYQVWGANRKIFLWPENWIEPELKRDRSPFFKDLENDLLQNEINQDNVEAAFSSYLEKLDKVAQLEIAGFFHEDDGDNAIVHVFGRTAGAEPHLYYYRRYDYRQWSPWEKVELDIQGDYLIPAVVNKRLYLFWPVFTEIPDEARNSRMTIPQPGEKRFAPTQTAKRLRLQMAVSDFRQGKWTPKKVSRDFYESEQPHTCEVVPENYRFTFIDRSDVDGRVGIQFEGHSVGSLAAARKTKQDLIQIANDAIMDQIAAQTAKTRADIVLSNAKSAVAFVKVPVEFAKSLVLDANNVVATSEDALKDAGAVYNVALPARGTTDGTITAANNAKAKVITATSPDATADAVIDATVFITALGSLRTKFDAVVTQAAANQGKPVVTPLTKAAHKAAHAAADAGADLLRSITTFKDNAAADAKSAARDLVKATLATQEAIKARDNFHADLNAHATLSGVFEISGCSGVPERGRFLRAVPPVLRPEFPSVGSSSYPSFSKWLELGSGIAMRQDAPDDDLSLIKYLPPTAAVPAANRSLFTPVLGLTPGIFKLTPSWHLSYFDSLWPDGKTGALLPFFYSDKQRTFFVPAVIWSANVSELSNAFGNVVCHYPDIKNTVAALNGLSAADRRALLDKLITYQWFHFKNFYHPFVCDFARLLNNPLQGVPGLMRRETQLQTSTFRFAQTYHPTASVLAPQTETYHPKEQVDFTPDGAYSPYNWELFFHAPLLIANALSKNQRFDEARDWYHFIFNPIGVESAAPGGSPLSKYWITKPFFQTTDPHYIQQRIDSVLRLLAGDTNATGYSAQAKKDLEDQVLDWRTNPFEPHRIASYRTVAYQKTVVMKYLDNLIAWGDNLFRQDSMESINEATQLYVLAAEILGPPPKKIPPQVKPPVASFNELENDLDKFSNALVQVENLLPQLTPQVMTKAVVGSDQAPLPMLYFCIPDNDRMLAYWDTVADRLYKIRHCLNIEGVARQLALFEPPIDPAALVKAVAGSLDLGSALAELNAPLPLYRFNVLLQKASELCGDVKALGNALLTTLEKKDAEALGLLRQSQEIRVLEAVKAVREKQLEEAQENLAAVKKNRELIVLRRDYYQDIEKVSASESLQQAKLEQALLAQQIAQVINIAASIAHIVPTFDMGVSGFGGSPKAAIMWGGPNVGSSLQATAGVFSVWANAENHAANKASINAGQERRWDEWKHQERLATKELEQIDRSIAAAGLRVTLATKELENHVIQIENAKATDEFMRSKYTNQELLQWQTGQISGVYFQSYKLAYDFAKRAERGFRFELGLADSSYISFGYWDSLKKGLLAGEKLQYDLRRLEAAYLEQNRREFELTKHISLQQLDPLALIKLRETGRCFLRLPEEIFDLDYPGHYFRRLKAVTLTLPCVVGPYTTISCTLRLLKNSIRINTGRENGYARATDQGLPADDDRFIENNIPVKAIAASTAQNDSGLFELSFRDERYLPFEGAGAISEWSLELFNDTAEDFGRDLRQFDYSTIADAILHVRYTAREDTGPFKNAAVAYLREYFSRDATAPSLRMFNLRHEFPTQWSRFLNPTNPIDGNIFELETSPKFFRLLDRDKTLQVTTVWLLARCTNPAGNYKIVVTLPLPAPPPITIPLTPLKQYGGWHFGQRDTSTLGIQVETSGPPARWQLQMTSGSTNLEKDPNGKMEVEDLILVLGYHWL